MKKLLIAGAGDIARRVVARLDSRLEVRALSRSRGVDFDRPEMLTGLAGWADTVLYSAPPPADAVDSDPRSGNFLAALLASTKAPNLKAPILPTRIVYLSTSGVYGDCAGELVDEARAPNPQTARARRRLAAERDFERCCRERGIDLAILRIPGIYAADRLPVDRLRRGIPALRAEDDIFTNHIQADDLAAAVLRALAPGGPTGIFNVCDDTQMKAGDWFDLVADRCGLPRPPRIARAEAARRIPAEQLSFLGESRRLDNRRMKEVLELALRYPTVRDGVPLQQSGASAST